MAHSDCGLIVVWVCGYKLRSLENTCHGVMIHEEALYQVYVPYLGAVFLLVATRKGVRPGKLHT